MCFGGRDKGDNGAARSRELDRVIRQDEKKLSKEVKLLLLGTSVDTARLERWPYMGQVLTGN